VQGIGTSSPDGFLVDYSLTNQWIVCSEAGLGPDYAGCLAELFVYISNNDYSDVTGAHTPSLMYLLTVTGQNVFVNLGPQGLAPFNDTPQIYLHGDRTTFSENHGGVTFFAETPPGSLTNCSDDPFPVRASLFDGNTYLRNDANLAGLPDYSPYGFVSYWYKMNPGDAGYILSVIINTDSTPSGLFAKCFSILHGSPNEETASFYPTLYFQNPWLPKHQWQFVYADSASPAAADGKWHHFMWSWDAHTTTVQFAVDGITRDLYIIQGSNEGGTAGSFTIPYTNPNTRWTIGADYDPILSTNTFFSGAISELFFLTGTYVDIADPNVRAKFINPDGTAADIAANGSTPFGQDLLPQIYLSGDSDAFPLNLPYNMLSQVFDATTAAYPFYVANDSNALQDAVSDPFGNGPLDGVGALPLALGEGLLGSAFIPKTVGPLNDSIGLPASIGSRPIPQ
jgi:hypothetical protein